MERGFTLLVRVCGDCSERLTKRLREAGDLLGSGCSRGRGRDHWRALRPRRAGSVSQLLGHSELALYMRGLWSPTKPWNTLS